jgi:hypothetical protein
VDVNCSRCGMDTELDIRSSTVLIVGTLGTFRSKDRLCGSCTTAIYRRFMRGQEIESAE